MGGHTCLRLFPLLQHLGLVGAAGPHPGSRGEHRSPLVHAGEQARRQAHIVQLVRSRCVYPALLDNLRATRQLITTSIRSRAEMGDSSGGDTGSVLKRQAGEIQEDLWIPTGNDAPALE